MINRAAILLKYKVPAVEWINEAEPLNEFPKITLESINEDRTVYLVPPNDVGDPDALEQWIEQNYEILFENELEGWSADASLWPAKRDLKLFKEWFDVERHTLIEDTVGIPIDDDEL